MRVLSLANRSSGRRTGGTEADPESAAGLTWCSSVGPRGRRSVSSWTGQTFAIHPARGDGGDFRSGGEAHVPVVQAADLG